MPWLRLDDAMGDHRKTRAALKDAGLSAFGLHSLGLLHCAKNQTDGKVGQDFLDDAGYFSRAKKGEVFKCVAALVDAGLWKPLGGDEWEINDYLEYNPSKAESEAKRKARAEAGRKGGRNKPSSKPEANASADASNREQPRPVPVPEPHPFSEESALAGTWAGTEHVDDPDLRVV
jgi:hypothetical protein